MDSLDAVSSRVLTLLDLANCAVVTEPAAGEPVQQQKA
jgi:hypothetical protein